ncbi:MAG: hypothetical protein U0360_11005 [Dehalococcoidia bacterium]
MTVSPDSTSRQRRVWHRIPQLGVALIEGRAGHLFVAATLALALALGSTSAQPRPVHGATTTTLAALIASAAPGDTVRVPAGTYREQVTIDRPLTLIADANGRHRRG